jgi:hypothetical protein
VWKSAYDLLDLVLSPFAASLENGYGVGESSKGMWVVRLAVFEYFFSRFLGESNKNFMLSLRGGGKGSVCPFLSELFFKSWVFYDPQRYLEISVVFCFL